MSMSLPAEPKEYFGSWCLVHSMEVGPYSLGVILQDKSDVTSS